MYNMHLLQSYLILGQFIFHSGQTQYQDPHSLGSGGSLPSSVPNQYKDYHRLQNQYRSPIDGSGQEPEFLTRGQRLRTELGDTVVLPCKIKNLGDSVVLWKRGDRVLSAGPIQVRKDYRLALVEASSLRITGVDVADTGKEITFHSFRLISDPFVDNYTCEVEWRGQPMQIIHFLEVLVPPQIEAVIPGGGVDRPVEAREGSDVQLECRADGIPTPVIRWRKNNGEYPRTNKNKPPKGPILEIPSVRKEDSGVYRCTASNGVGVMSADQIELHVLYPPEVKSAKQTVYGGKGETSDLSCMVIAEPKAKVSWYLNGRPIRSDSRRRMEEHGTLAVLRIQYIDPKNDFGNYSCEAENVHGSARDHIELSGKPEVARISSPPEGLYRTSYNLTWTVSSLEPLTEVRLLFRKIGQGHYSDYNGTWSNLLLRLSSGIQSEGRGSFLKESSSEWSSRKRSRQYHVLSHHFKDLTPHSRYEVILQSKNKYGWSEGTKSFVFSTRLQDFHPKNLATSQNGRSSLQDGLISGTSSNLSIFTLPSILNAILSILFFKIFVD